MGKKNNFIDLTQILRTFEKGTKLKCFLHDDVFFEEVTDDLVAPIICKVGKGNDNFKIYLTKYGQLYNCNEAKRVILPVDGTWEEYMFRFNDGDFLYNTIFGFVICYCKKFDILSKPEDYFTIDLRNKKVDVSHSRNYGILEEYRRANEEEIKSVYDILRKNNKVWNSREKELLTYRMPFCKVGDIVWCSKTNKNEEVVAVGYDCDTEDYFYDLKDLNFLRENDLAEKRLPFKVGDIVTDGAYEYEIIRVGDLSYDTDVSFNINYCNLENYRLVEYENFNFKTLRPFDKVIVYTSFGWTCDFFSHANSDYSNFYCVSDVYDKIVPFNEETVSLLGTHDEIPLKYRLKRKVKQ